MATISSYGRCTKWFLLVLGLVLFSACQPSCERTETEDVAKSDQHLSKDIAAIVNNVKLNTADLDALHKRANEQFRRTGRTIDNDLDKKLRGSILRKMIDDELIAQRAEKEGIKIDRFERVAAIENYKERMGGQKGYDLYLERQKLTREQMEKSVIAEVQRDKLVQKLSGIEEPTEEEIKAYYNANQKLFGLPEMVHARHLLLKLSPNEPQEKADLVLKKAHEILKEAQSGESFESLVQKYSEGPSVKQNGDLGFFPRGRMNKAFEDAAFAAKPKTTVGPVKTEYGYHLIYVEEKSPPKNAPLEDVRPRIVEMLKRNRRGMKSEDLLTSLRKDAKVKINDYSMTVDEYREHGNEKSERAQASKD